jgi:uncharacterized membrane protein YgdD (TMEM256/DUF423 family)
MMSLFWSRTFLIFAGISGAMAVAAGAYASHGLAAMVEPRLVDMFDKAAHYQLVHAVALLALAMLSTFKFFRVWSVISGVLFAAGIVLFSGSLYIRVLTDDPAWGSVTPTGGVCFILGWIALVIAGLRASSWRGSA